MQVPVAATKISMQDTQQISGANLHNSTSMHNSFAVEIQKAKQHHHLHGKPAIPNLDDSRYKTSHSKARGTSHAKSNRHSKQSATEHQAYY
jgi:hypothetical protein